MPRRKEATTPLTENEVVLREITRLHKKVQALSQPGVVAALAIDKDYYMFPIQGEVEWNYPNARGYIFHDHEWWPLMPPTLYIKLQKDIKETVVDDDNFKFMVGRDMHLHYLIDAEAYITTGGSIELGLQNNTQSGSLLTSNLIVTTGNKNTMNSTPKRVINTGHQVHWGDELEVTVVAVGGSAMGAGCMLTFSGKPLPRDLDA